MYFGETFGLQKLGIILYFFKKKEEIKVKKSRKKKKKEEPTENSNFEIEKILAEKVLDGKRVYRVRWKGFSSK